MRNRAGATLTPAGRRFLRHARTLVLTVEQARHTLLPVGPRRDTRWPDEDYVYPEWGPAFHAKHREGYPGLQRSAQVIDAGCCFLPMRMVQTLVHDGRLMQVADGPGFAHPGYMMFPREADSEVQKAAPL